MRRLVEGSDVFVQVMEGQVGDEEGLQAQLGAWMSDEDCADVERLMSLMEVDRYIDLPNPMLYSR